MSAESPKKGGQTELGPCRLLEAAEFDLSAAAPGQGIPAGEFEPCATVLEPTEIDCAEPVAAGPAVALRLTLRLAPGADRDACTREFVELLHALHDHDLALGGRGLVLDPSESEASDGLLTVVLRPLDIRWSQDRFAAMAALLGGQADDGSDEPNQQPDGSERIVLSLRRCEGQTPPGLEQEIADLIRTAISKKRAAPEAEDWQPAGEADRSEKAAMIEARLRHVSDEVETGNRRRTAARDHPLTTSAAEQAAPAQPPLADLDEAGRRIVACVRALIPHVLGLDAEVKEEGPTAQRRRTDAGS